MHKNSTILRPGSTTTHAFVYRLAGAGSDETFRGSSRPGRASAAREDLPYQVELWDSDKQAVEQVLAVTANGSIGYAAYYAATREYPERYITLRHKGGIISRWNGPEH